MSKESSLELYDFSFLCDQGDFDDHDDFLHFSEAMVSYNFQVFGNIDPIDRSVEFFGICTEIGVDEIKNFLEKAIDIPFDFKQINLC